MDDKNKSLDFFYNVLPQFVSQRLHCISLGKVTKYDKKQHTANVLPLTLDDGDKKPSIIDCPVPSSIWQTDDFMKKICKNKYVSIDGYKPLKVGSVVTIGFFDEDMDNFNGDNKNIDADTSRHHSLNDGVILGVMKP